MNDEETIDKMVSSLPSVSREEAKKRLEKERQRTGGLISDAVLLKMIAADTGCLAAGAGAPAQQLLLKDLLPGLYDVTVTGRIMAIFPSKTFERTKRGKLASMYVADESEILRVILWNENADLVESGKLVTGQVVRLNHIYTRGESGGKIELHVGDKSKIEVDPPKVNKSEYPSASRFSTKIGELKSDLRNKRVNLTGVVTKVFPASTFEREDSSEGKVLRFTLNDGTDEIAVVVWNEKADELEKTLKTSVRLQLVNARTKKALDGRLEINIDSAAYLGPLVQTDETVRINDLKEGQSHVLIQGEITAMPVVRDVRTSRGETVRLATFELKDETGKIQISAWRNHADAIGEFKKGNRIVIKNAFVRKGFGDQLEVSTGISTSFKLVE